MGGDVRKISYIAGRNIECYRLIRWQYEYLLKLKKIHTYIYLAIPIPISILGL